MVYEFRVNIILRVLVLLLLVAGGVYSFSQQAFLTTGFLGILLAMAVVNIIHYVNQTNRDLANFFASIQYDDFTTTGSAGHKGTSFGELHRQFNFINKKFQEIRAEKEANHQFLQTIVEHIDIGLLGVKDDGEVNLMNKALQAMLHKSYLINLDALEKVDLRLWEVVKNLQPGERELIKINIDNQLQQLAIQCIELMLNREHFRLFSFQNIQSELEQQEMAAWQKLIRILTHEIMNSVAPIASLSSTMHDFLVAQKNGQLEAGDLEQVTHSLSVIRRRSEGLLDFTETYRRLTRIPPPKFQLLDARALIGEVHTLFRPELEEHGIAFSVDLQPDDITFQGDPALLEQVLINLIKNAMDAVREREKPKIQVFVQKLANGKIVIQVADNGSGIDAEQLEQIFVPFYTTKESGSGIGLSLSRQIIRLHKGNIEVQSVVGEGTAVKLTL